MELQLVIDSQLKESTLRKAMRNAIDVARMREETRKIVRLKNEQLKTNQSGLNQKYAVEARIEEITEPEAEVSFEELELVVDRQTFEEQNQQYIESMIEKCKQRIRENENDREAWREYLMYCKMRDDQLEIDESVWSQNIKSEYATQ